MKKFGLNTLDDLPDLPKYKMDENRQIVIEEILENHEEINSKEEAEEGIEEEETKEPELKGDEEPWKMI